jgi:cyclic dehypoxanthinyl futalosine synthase
VLSRDEVFAKIDELVELGGDLVAFNGGFNPKLPLDFYCDLFAAVRARYGERVEFYALTIAEFVFLADRAGISYAEAAAAAARGRRALDHRRRLGDPDRGLPRRHAKWKYTVADYFEAQRAIVEAGLQTTATMVIGFDETLDERLEHLQRTRDFQDEVGGLFSFLCWTYKPYGTAFGGREISPREYWRHIALSRIFLDNVKHIRTSVLTQNEDAFRALDYGADDFDLPIEDEVTEKAGATIDLDLEGLLAIPRRLGYEVEYRRAERPAALTRGSTAARGRKVRCPHVPVAHLRRGRRTSGSRRLRGHTSRTAAGEQPAGDEALTERELTEAEAYEAKWHEEDKERYRQERLP